MKYKVKLRYGITGQVLEKVSFHLEERAPLVLGRTSSVFKLNGDDVADRHCSLFVEEGQLFVSDEGSKSGTFLNQEKIRSRALHVGDILKVGAYVFEFLEVPIAAASTDQAKTQFLDLNAPNANTHTLTPAPLAPAAPAAEVARFKIPEKAPGPASTPAVTSAPAVSEAAPELTFEDPAGDPAQPDPVKLLEQWGSLSKSQRKKKLKELKRLRSEALAQEQQKAQSAFESERNKPIEIEAKPARPSRAEVEAAHDAEVAHELERARKALTLRERERDERSRTISKTISKTTYRKSSSRSDNSERARVKAEMLKRRLDEMERRDGTGETTSLTERFELPRLGNRVRENFIRSAWMQVGIGVSVAFTVIAGYGLFSGSPAPSGPVATQGGDDTSARGLASAPEVPSQAQAPIDLVATQTAQAPQAGASPVAPPPVRRDYSSELVEAAAIGDLNRVQSLIFEDGADPDAKNLFGETPLMAASSKGHTHIVRLLIDKGVNLNASDPEGSTALMKAITSGQPKVVQLLVYSGASIRLRNRKGDTALRLATRWGRQDIVNFLKGSGSNPALQKRRPAGKK